MWLEGVAQDVRFGARLLRNSPSFIMVAVLTLALAIGANAVLFSVMNAFIFHPLNVPAFDSLYLLERGPDKLPNLSYPYYLDLRDRNHSFDDLAAFDIGNVGLDTGNNPVHAWVEIVSGSFFDVLRIQPHLGRFIHSSDEHGPNSAPYVVLSHAYWHTHFHDDPAVIGRIVQVNQHPFTIVGVAPDEFHGTLMFFYPDFFVPLVNVEQITGRTDLNQRGSRWIFETFGHLRPGVTTAQAIADLNSIGAELARSHPRDDSQLNFYLARPSLHGDFLGPAVQGFLVGLMMLSGLILLAACANLGNLFAARAADRSREVAMRLALGARRVRILRQLFTEAILISLAGGAAGLWGSVLLLRQMSAWQPLPKFPVHVPVNPDAGVYLLALALALVSGLLFGAVPVRQVLRTDPYDIVKSGSRSTTERRISVRDVLLALQIASCALLVTSSFVAMRGLVRSLHSSFGFDLNTLLIETDLNMSGYRGEAVTEMQKRMIDAARRVPGVLEVGLADVPPLATGGWNSESVYADDATDFRPGSAVANPIRCIVSPEYFRAAGTALLSGRTFTWHDDTSAPAVAVINEAFARKVFGSANQALGAYFKRRGGGRVQVVGIVETGKYTGLTEDPRPAMFFPFLQVQGQTSTYLVVRAQADPMPLAPAITSALHALDSSLPLTTETWGNALEATLFGARMAALALGVLGVMAAMLAVTGIFGMAAYSVSKRLKELGIRVALGAQRRQVLQAALGRALKVLAIGSTAGLVLGLLASRVLAMIVYQATPRDPLVLAGVVAAMLLVGLLATWLPAQRALSINPWKLLREE
jgi:predicted permease